MRGIETTPAETAVLIIAFACFFASYAARIRLFVKEWPDPKLRELIGDSSMIGLDTLAFRLVLHWKRLSNSSKLAVGYFVAPYLIFFFGLIGVVISAYVRVYSSL